MTYSVRQLAVLHRLEHPGQVPARAWAESARRQTRSNCARSLRVSRRRGRPAAGSGCAPMSPPPCTLFCPRRGLSPEPQRPTWPVSSARLISANTLSTRVVVLGDAERPAELRPVGPRVGVRHVADRRRPARPSRARRTPACTSRRTSRYASKPVVARSMNARFSRPAARISRAHGVGERDVGADVEAEPACPPTARRSSGADRRRTAARRCARP